MAFKTYPPNQRPGSLILFELTNLGTTRRSITLPSGAVNLTFYLKDKGSSTLSEVWIVFNSGSDTEADALLGTVGVRVPMFVGDTVSIPSSDPVTRIDFLASAAETGAHKMVVYATLGVDT